MTFRIELAAAPAACCNRAAPCVNALRRGRPISFILAAHCRSWYDRRGGLPWLCCQTCAISCARAERISSSLRPVKQAGFIASFMHGGVLVATLETIRGEIASCLRMALQRYQNVRQRTAKQFRVEEVVRFLKGTVFGLGDCFYFFRVFLHGGSLESGNCIDDICIQNANRAPND